MTALITRKIKCNLPWSSVRIIQFEDCKTEEDYENYLKSIIEEQDAIEEIPVKCRYKIWSMTHYADESREGNITSVRADLFFTKGQVCNCTYYVQISFSNHIYDFSCLSFVGQ